MSAYIIRFKVQRHDGSLEAIGKALDKVYKAENLVAVNKLQQFKRQVESHPSPEAMLNRIQSGQVPEETFNACVAGFQQLQTGDVGAIAMEDALLKSHASQDQQARGYLEHFKNCVHGSRPDLDGILGNTGERDDRSSAHALSLCDDGSMLKHAKSRAERIRRNCELAKARQSPAEFPKSEARTSYVYEYHPFYNPNPCNDRVSTSSSGLPVGMQPPPAGRSRHDPSIMESSLRASTSAPRDSGHQSFAAETRQRTASSPSPASSRYQPTTARTSQRAPSSRRIHDPSLNSRRSSVTAEGPQLERAATYPRSTSVSKVKTSSGPRRDGRNVANTSSVRDREKSSRHARDDSPRSSARHGETLALRPYHSYGRFGRWEVSRPIRNFIDPESHIVS